MLDSFFPWITDLHKTLLFQWMIPPIVGLAFLAKFRLKGLLLFLSLLLCLGSTDFVGSQGIKDTVQRARPGDNTEISAVVRSPYGGYSFFSNHAANMFAFAVFVSAFFVSLRWPLIFVAALVGYSRIYNGVHFPSDVLFGALFGITLGIVFSSGARRWLNIKKESKL